MWTYITSWFAPTFLFLLLNLVVGTIFIISRFGSDSRPQNDHFSTRNPPPLARAPSLLDRVRSINFYGHRSEQPEPHTQTHHVHHPVPGYEDRHYPNPLVRTPSLLERVKSITFPSYYRADPLYPEPEYNPHTDASDRNVIPEPQAQTHLYDPVPGYEERHHPSPLARAPSFLERVRSINFPSFYGPDPTYPEPEFNPHTDSTDRNVIPEAPLSLSRAPSLLERVKSINLRSFYRSDSTNMEPELTPEIDIDINLIPDPSAHNDNHDHHVNRSKSESRVVTKPSRQADKMTKSASEKSKMALLDDWQEDRESIERRRPATTKIEKTGSFGDNGVDAKADDFINRFKQQLRLQRLDSLLRNKETSKGK